MVEPMIDRYATAVKYILACMKCGAQRYFAEEPPLQALHHMWCSECRTHRTFTVAPKTESEIFPKPVPSCPECAKGPMNHDNSVCRYRFAAVVFDWIKLPEKLQTPFVQ